MKPPYYRSVSSKGAGRPRLTHHHKGRWNGTKWMRWRWRNGGMKFVVGENGRNPAKNLPRPRFVHHETHMEWPRCELGTPVVGGERLTACATRPPQSNVYREQLLLSWQHSIASAMHHNRWERVKYQINSDWIRHINMFNLDKLWFKWNQYLIKQKAE